jgi:hypothetical protein
LSSVGLSIIGSFGKYPNCILRLFSLSIHVCCVVVLEDEEEEKPCPRASLFRDRITIVIVIIIKNSNDENSITEEENAEIWKIIYY